MSDEKTRILFVDDEPNILQGLKRMLRSMRNEWELEFSSDPKEAITWLDKEPCDVVVSDMRMPGIDGCSLLEHVKDNHPHIIRIILSGYSDQELAMRSTNIAHQFLSKPSNLEGIKGAVERSIKLKSYINNDALSEIVAEVSQLPTPPSLYNKVTSMLSNENCALEDLGTVIKTDPSMTSKILKLVNSSFFGNSSDISSVDEALAVLGINTIKTLILTVSIFSGEDRTQKEEAKLDALLEHCALTSNLCEALAGHLKQPRKEIETASITGLLHDIGKIIFETQVPKDYHEIVQKSLDAQIPLFEAEYEALQTSHAEMGAYLIGLWGLPNNIVEPIAFHHSPKNCSVQEINGLTILHFANVAASKLKPNDLLGVEQDYDLEYLKSAGLSEEDIKTWEALCQETFEESLNQQTAS
tara:strand:+ start:22571 stop:23809 length:1239 start_codon:yes stop_codon:yes gene_type:complete